MYSIYRVEYLKEKIGYLKNLLISANKNVLNKSCMEKDKQLTYFEKTIVDILIYF